MKTKSTDRHPFPRVRALCSSIPAALFLAAFSPAMAGGGVTSVILNGGFENGTDSWLSSGNLEAQTLASPPPNVSEGTGIIAFNPSNLTPNAVLSQSFQTVPGMIYQLRFNAGTLAYNKRTQSLGISVEGTSTLLDKKIDFKGLGDGKFTWMSYCYVFTADGGTASLSFRDRSVETNGIDLVLDEVSVMCEANSIVVTSVPDPGVVVTVDPPDLTGSVGGPTPLSLIYNPGGTVVISAPASADGKAFDGWFRNEVRFSSQTAVHLTTDGDDLIEARYSDLRPRILVQPVHASAVEGGVASFSVTAGGAEPLDYRWSLDGWTIPGEHGAVLKIDPVSLQDQGDYGVEVSNEYGSAYARGVMLTVVKRFPGLENPGFESNLAGWSVSGNLGIQSAPPYQPAEGGKLLSFNAGDSPPNGVVSQAFDTVPGRPYFLTFNMGALSYNNSTQKLGVEAVGDCTLFTDVFAVTGAGGGKTRWTTRNLLFTADSERTTLVFRDRSAVTRSIDLLLDHVVLSTPEIRTLTIHCDRSGVPIEIWPHDLNELQSAYIEAGLDPLIRSYEAGAVVRVELIGQPQLNFSSSNPDDSVSYRLLNEDDETGISTLIEFVMEADITLTVVYESTAPVITRQPEDQVVNYGGTAVFEVNAIGSTDMNYEWRFNGWIFQSGPSNTAVLENVGSDYDGLYEVTVSNNFGSTTSRAARLTTVGNWFDNQGFEYGLESWNAAGNVRTQASASTDPGNRMVAAFNTGNTTPNGSLCQVVGVDPGKTYLVTFDLGVTAYNTAEQRMLVRIDGAGPLFEGEFTIKGRGNGLTTWQRTSLVFTADAYSAVISFTDGSAVTHAIDMLLDNVDISEVADGAVPMSAEPSEIE